MASPGDLRAVITAMVANGGIAIAKFVAYLFTGSASMLAESIHSVADTSNQGLLLLGSKRARRVASDRHQFGYGRERYFWAFVVAMVLFSLGGVFSIFEGIEKIRHPHEITSVGWAIGVLLIGIVLEGFAYRTAIVQANLVRGDQGWWRFIRTSRSPELPVILLEDTGAMIGLSLALAGVGLTTITGNPVWDGIGTLAIGMLLVAIAIVLTIEMQSLLIGEAATKANVDAIERVVEDHASVQRVIELRSQHLGPDELLVAGKLEFDPSLDAEEVSRVIDEIEGEMREAISMTMRIYLEPDIHTPHPIDQDLGDPVQYPES